MKKQLFFIAITAFILSSCGHVVKEIPSGFIGKLLTPTGFDKNILEPGQVDLGDVSSNGQYTSLVLAEATTITVKESFGQSASNKDSMDTEDHRVMTKTTPLTVDIYVQMAVPKDPKLRNELFSAITPKEYKSGDDRTSVIYLDDIYSRFAKMTVRGKLRGIFAQYNDWSDVMNNFEKVNAQIGQMVMEVFKSSNVPLDLISVQLSNVKEDQRIWDSKNEVEAANNKVKAIEKLGDAMKNNPGYIQIRKWEVLEKLISSPNASNITLIISDDNKEPIISLPNKNK